MNRIAEQLQHIKQTLPARVTLVVVSKNQPVADIILAYDTGHRAFGENRVQELVPKYEALPKDIAWHLIGHLQSNKVKHIASFISLIQSIDSEALLLEVNKQAAKHSRVIDCLLQIHIAQEETKFGFTIGEAKTLLLSAKLPQLEHVRVIGLMGMATNTDNTTQIKMELSMLKHFFEEMRTQMPNNSDFTKLSMGMSADYSIAIEEGSNLIRVGSTIFGNK